jgi:hypothetical protein
MRKAIFLFAVGFASTAALVSSHQHNAVAVERGGALREVLEVAKRPVIIKDPIEPPMEDYRGDKDSSY